MLTSDRRPRIHIDLKNTPIDPVDFRTDFYEAIRDITTKDALMVQVMRLVIQLSKSTDGRYFISDLASGNVTSKRILGGE